MSCFRSRRLGGSRTAGSGTRGRLSVPARGRQAAKNGQIHPGNHIRIRQDEYGITSAARIG